jgi:hypothetical protein
MAAASSNEDPAAVPLHVTGIAKSDLALFGESIQGRGAGGMRVDLLPQAIHRPTNGGGNEGVANEGKRWRGLPSHKSPSHWDTLSLGTTIE